MKKWLIIPGFILLIVSTVWAYTLTHTGEEIDRGVAISLDIGGTAGVPQSDGAENISHLGVVTAVGDPGSDTNLPTEQAVREAMAAGGVGEANIGANVGTGEGDVYRDKTGVTLNLKTIKAGSNVTVTNNADDITIGSTGGASVGTGTTLPGTCTAGDLFIDTDADTTGWLYFCASTDTWKATPAVVTGISAPYTLYRDSDAVGAALEDQDAARVDINMETVTEDAEDGSVVHKAMKNGTQTSYIAANMNTNLATFGGSGVGNNFLFSAGIDDLDYSGDIHDGLLCGANLSAGDLVTINPAVANKIVLADADGAGLWPARGVLVAACTTGNAGLMLTKGYYRNDAWTLGTTQPGHIWLDDVAGDFVTTDPESGFASGDCIQIVGHSINADVAFFDFSRPYSNKK